MIHNIFFWFLMLVINFSCILFAYRKFGKIGLYIWVPISTILANVQVVILVNLFGLEATLGNILYAGGFLITDILSENYGKKAANTAVKIGFFSLIATTLIMQCAIHFKPLDVPEGLAIFESVKSIFSLLPRLAIASLIAYLISQFHDVCLYHKIREFLPEKKLSQLIDNVVFTTIAFYGVYPIDVMFNIFLSTYIIKFIVAICDTPFIYLADKMFRDKKIPEDI